MGKTFNSNWNYNSKWNSQLNEDYGLIWDKKKVIEPLPTVNWYFAFGSNMSRKRMQKRGLIWEHILKAKLPNHQLCFNKKAYSIGEGFANIVKCDGEMVEGVLYKLEEKEQAHILDDFEGTPLHYERKEIFVKCSQFAKPIKAFTYIANAEQIDNELAPSEDYLNHLLDGKRYLSNKYYYWLSQTPTVADLDTYEDLPVFVYGTLKSGFGNHNRFCKNAYSVQSATVNGTLYDVGLPYLTIDKIHTFGAGSMDYKQDAKLLAKLRFDLDQKTQNVEPINPVHGELICFDDWNELYNLDSLEGFTGKGGYNHYNRVLTTCWIGNCEEACWVYVDNTNQLKPQNIVADGSYKRSVDTFLSVPDGYTKTVDDWEEYQFPELYEDEKDLVDLLQNADNVKF